MPLDSDLDLLVWVDLETTGLDPTQGRILELGLLLTNADLVHQEARSWVIKQPPEILGGMGDWCLRQHGKSGLIADSAASKLSLELVGAQARAWLGSRGPQPGSVPMCGASVHFDRAWLKRWLPDLEAWFYYGNLDVSSIGRLAKLWYPDLTPWTDTEIHRVDPDNEDAVAELAYYREHLFATAAVMAPR